MIDALVVMYVAVAVLVAYAQVSRAEHRGEMAAGVVEALFWPWLVVLALLGVALDALTAALRDR